MSSFIIENQLMIFLLLFYFISIIEALYVQYKKSTLPVLFAEEYITTNTDPLARVKYINVSNLTPWECQALLEYVKRTN